MSELRRVALVCPYALDVFGGVQEQVLGMSRELTRRGLEVLVLSPDGGAMTAPTPATVERVGKRFSVPANGSVAPITLSLAASRSVRRRLDDFAPDVVHLHEPFAPVLGYAELLGGARRARVGTFHRAGGGPAYALTTPLLRRLLRGLHARVAVSPAAAATLRDATGVASDVLFNGFELDRFARTSPREGVTVLYVGRLETRKGVASLVEAVTTHNRTDATPWELLIAGDGNERAALERAAQGDERVRFLGAVSDDEKRALLGSVSVMVTPSLFGESFGLTVLEGMASRTPMVVADIDGYRDAAGGHAVLYRAGDAGDLARAINDALRVGEDVLDAAYEHARGWSMATLMDAYLERYERARALASS